LLPGEDGIFETAIYSANPDEWGYIDYTPLEDASALISEDFAEFTALCKTPASEFKPLIDNCAYSLWLNLQETGGGGMFMSGSEKILPMVYDNRVRNGSALAYEQPLYALALSDAKAAMDLAFNDFPQMEKGMLPANVGTGTPCYRAFPPTHGLAVLQTNLSGFEREALQSLYELMATHFEWWRNSHSLHNNEFSYNMREEYGFPNSSFGALTFPLEAPDLYTFMILYSDALTKLADAAGNGKSGEWSDISGRLLKSLLKLWDGTSFTCKNALSGEIFKSQSLLAYLPIALGKRLPSEIIDALSLDLADSDKFLSNYGFRSESKSSVYYDGAVSGRGAVDMSLQMLIIGGLFESGKTELAESAAKKLLTNGIVRDVLIADGAQPPRRPGDEYNPIAAAAMIYIAGILGKEER
ncbi:MAG: hypothetical protein LBN43_05630, partial [Oscillospiraceae bacterium]|nr:hypothetical protein [Oscillospiraceae bacterium]